MAHEEVLSILDQALQDFSAIEKEEGIREVLRAVFLAIEQHVNATAGDVPGLRSRLPQLVSLYSVQPNWGLLESLIARAVDSTFVAGIDGVPAGASNSSALGSFVVTSCSRWSKRVEFRSEGLDISVFLNRPKWTPHTVSVIKSFIYASETARLASRTFLESTWSLNQPALHLAPVIWSWFDASDITSNVRSSGTWRKHFEQLTASIVDIQAPRDHRLTCRRAIHAMVQKLPSLRSELFSDLLARVKCMPVDTLTSEMLRLGKSLIEILPRESDTFASSLLEHALAWVSRSFGGPDNLDGRIVATLGAMLPVRGIFMC
jgi:nucleolar pre-ribosomal-associated protein 1